MDSFFIGVTVMYLWCGAYVWWLADMQSQLKKRLLGFFIITILWPLFLCDVKMDRR